MSDEKTVKDDRKYSKEHEWAREQDGEITVGVSAFAVSQLGDITMVNVDLAVGDTVEAGKPFGTIESVKTLSDLYAPISGKLTRVNTDLEDQPELINEDCWEAGWMIAIEKDAGTTLDALMGPEAYKAHLDAQDH